MSQHYTFIKGTSPLVITAIHDGHLVREELNDLFALDEKSRLREEDPFTGKWTLNSDNRIIVHHSRFEADINRPREKAVYQKPEDAWGLEVWKEQLPSEIVENSLAYYDEFYKAAKNYFDDLFSMHEKVIVFDLHSYNHQRDGVGKIADQATNPDINIGTGNMNRDNWDHVLKTILDSFRNFNFDGIHLDVRENIKFKGGYFGKWLFENYGDSICIISIEFKKIFMDEYSGKGFEKDINLISEMVQEAKQSVLNIMQTNDS